MVVERWKVVATADRLMVFDPIAAGGVVPQRAATDPGQRTQQALHEEISNGPGLPGLLVACPGVSPRPNP